MFFFLKSSFGYIADLRGICLYVTLLLLYHIHTHIIPPQTSFAVLLFPSSNSTQVAIKVNMKASYDCVCSKFGVSFISLGSVLKMFHFKCVHLSSNSWSECQPASEASSSQCSGCSYSFLPHLSLTMHFSAILG